MTCVDKRIGFIQGRLSSMVDDRIQAFPVTNWEHEFFLANALGITNMEWTIDTQSFSSNPLVSKDGCHRIMKLCRDFNVKIPSVTCDYYMENPHWKNSQVDIKRDLYSIFEGMNRINSKILVIPLVDNSSIKFNSSMNLSFFLELEKIMIDAELQIAFEVDLDAESTQDFINLFPPDKFGINYDIGNSAFEGFSTEIEIFKYGNRIINVHVKDRLFRGTTVPLGLGAANIPATVSSLFKVGYQGNFIMQTARAKNEDHAEELMRNIEFFTEAAKNA
jgi:L-ribulose-5-phosphate 3-epimerase